MGASSDCLRIFVILRFSQFELIPCLSSASLSIHICAAMSADEDNGVTITPPERFAIGLSFGNSNSSIAHTSNVGLFIMATIRS